MSETPAASTDPALLERVHTEPRLFVVALAVMIVIGLAVASLHWVGLVLGGMLVAIVSKTQIRAVGAALVFVLAVGVLFAIQNGGDVTAVPGMAPLSYVTLGAGVGLPLFGSLARSVLP